MLEQTTLTISGLQKTSDLPIQILFIKVFKNMKELLQEIPEQHHW